MDSQNNLGFVVRGVYNGVEVAVKKIPRQLTSGQEDDITKVLMQLDHENVLKILTVNDDGFQFSRRRGSTVNNFFESNTMNR